MALHILTRLAVAQRLGFVAVDVEEGGFIGFRHGFQLVLQEFLGFVGAGIHIDFGVGHLLIKRDAERFLGVGKALLVAEKLDVELGGVLLQLLDLLGGQPVGGRDVGQAVQLEQMLGVEVEEVHLVLRQRGDLALEELHCGHGAATDVVHPSAVFQGRIVRNPHTRHLIVEMAAQLVQTEPRIVESRLGGGGHHHPVGQDFQDITLLHIGVDGQCGHEFALYGGVVI